jgi:hypothetical protein
VVPSSIARLGVGHIGQVGGQVVPILSADVVTVAALVELAGRLPGHS